MEPKTILIVDDEFDIASTLETVLSMEGYAVRVVFNGKQALESLNKEPLPDLIFTDLMMPVLDGYALISTLKADARFRDIPVIASSAGVQDRSRMPKDGVESFLRKPFDLEHLISTVRKVISEKKSSP